jgi:capsular exopolysaccharide synthesis family protein
MNPSSEPDRAFPALMADHPAPALSGAPFDAPLPDAGGATTLRRYLGALWRHKLLVLVALLLGGGGGAIALRYIQPKYLAQATIWIQVMREGGGRPALQGPIQSGQLLESYAWLDLLRSYAVLDPVIEAERLYLKVGDPANARVLDGFRLREPFQPGDYRLSLAKDGRSVMLSDAKGVLLQQGGVGDSLGQALGFAWVPAVSGVVPGATVKFSVRHPRDVARQLGDGLKSEMQQNGNFLRIALAGTDPVRATATVNAIAERYETVAAELKRRKLDELTSILDEQLRYADQNLRNAEAELERFRVATITLPTEGGTPVTPGLQQAHGPAFTNFFNMKVEQEQLRRDRSAIERALAEPSALGVASLEYIEAVRNSSELLGALQELTTRRAELRALRRQYTDEHPTVQRLDDGIRTLEQEAIPVLARTLLGELQERERQIDGLVRSASAELQRIPTRQLEEARLTRRVALADNLFTTLRQSYEAARLAAASSIPDVRILDRAVVPREPVEDKRPRVLLMALLGGLGLGVLGALLLDRFDPRLRYPEQVTQGLRLSVIGAIPLIKRPGRVLQEGHTSHMVEAFRELRLGVMHAHGAAGPLVMTVTSPGSGDGKSFVAANLTLSFADQGHRVLLIDGDIRRGAQHRVFGLGGKPGLTDFLSGSATLEEVVRSTSFPSLDLLPCGSRLHEGPELLGSSAMGELMQALRSRYDVIIVDSAPLGAGVDPFVLGTRTGNVLLVLRSGYTDREFTEAKLELLDRLPLRILGAVLNAVPPHGAYRYYAYLPGYEAVEEEGVLVKSLPGG